MLPTSVGDWLKVVVLQICPAAGQWPVVSGPDYGDAGFFFSYLVGIMEYHTLLTGIICSIGIFAVKAGIGVYYYMVSQEQVLKRVVFLFSFALVYVFVFVGFGWVLKHINLLEHLDLIMKFAQSGMLVHFFMAGLMTLWGIGLLNRQPGTPSKSWLLLVFPCPVCLSVILMTTTLLYTVFPSAGLLTALFSGGSFVAVSLSAAGVFYLMIRYFVFRSLVLRNMQHENILGCSMLIIAGYFILSSVIMPYFAEIDSIYHIAASGNNGSDIQSVNVGVLAILVSVMFLTGYGIKMKKIREVSWKSEHC